MKTPFQLALLGLAAFCSLSAPSEAQWKPASGQIKTRWAAQVSPQNALPAYPRPQMTRNRWQNLNGLWSYGLSDLASTRPPATMNEKILVPFPFESALSGVGAASPTTKKLWYRRTFTVPAAWKGARVLLHFGAVNYDSSVMLNGKMLGSHRGGFDGFGFDVTPQLRAGQNELVVSATNPLKADTPDTQVTGKQRIRPGGIFYTGATGIWQSVWLEPVPQARINGLKITPDIDASRLNLVVNSGANSPVKVTALDGNKVVAVVQGKANSPLRIPITNARLWSPDSPFLYRLKVDLGAGKNADSVGSYFAMRKISLGKDAQGRQRIFLNNKFVFQVGVLDQGYWPDGIFTAPTDDALKYDVQIAKDLGWNMLRKHAKVEPARWYYHADKIGMLVWQDMPQMYGGQNGALSDAAKTQFETEWREIIAENLNSPSIVVWTLFNEGWGQHDTERLSALTKRLDSSRLVNSVSGWVDKNVGDMHDTHAYPGPASNAPEANRAAVLGEFGGITYDAGRRWINNASVMGYGSTLKSSWLATKRFQELMKRGYALKDAPGTSALVYTQLTDVEQEINGALTYDRAVIKLDAAILTAANKGRFLALPPNPNPDLVPTADAGAINWRYSFQNPGANWFTPAFDASNWQVGAAPFGNGMSGVRTPWTTSDIWIRRNFTLPNQIPAKLNLTVKHDENAEIYLNGVLAATVSGFNNDYVAVPVSDAARAALLPGQNLIAVHVRQTVGGQGIDVGIAAAR